MGGTKENKNTVLLATIWLVAPSHGVDVYLLQGEKACDLFYACFDLYSLCQQHLEWRRWREEGMDRGWRRGRRANKASTTTHPTPQLG